MSKISIITLSQGIVLPVLSRRTGAPCRTVATGELITRTTNEGLQLVGCRDRRGRVFRAAVRDGVRVQARLLKHGRELGIGDDLLLELAKLPEANFDMSADGSPFTFVSMGIADAVPMFGGWPAKDGAITVQMRPVAGMLIPTSDPVTGPFREMGLLWPNGDFARSGNDVVISFGGSRGVLFAASYPAALADKVIDRNAVAWGDGWEPATVRESDRRFAERVATTFGARKHSPLDAALVKRVLAKKVLDTAPPTIFGDGRKPVTWRNGFKRDGTPMNPNDGTLCKLFAPILEAEFASADRM